MAWASRTTSTPVSAPAPSKLREVKLDGLVVLKIIKHCQENFPESVAGSLLGLDVEDVLEVTHSFPLPRDDDTGDGEYEMRMLQSLRQVNIDNNAVGWYQSSYMGSYCTKDTIQHQLQYQDTLPKSVMLIYDGVKTSQGTLSIKALRLTDSFCETFKGRRVTAEVLATLSPSSIFEELPVKIGNPDLIQAFLLDMTLRHTLVTTSSAGSAAATGPKAAPTASTSGGAAAASDSATTPAAAVGGAGASVAEALAATGDAEFSRLELNSGPYLEKHLDLLSEATDSLLRAHSEAATVARRQEQLRRQREEWLQKRKEENADRAARGEDPLPLEDPSLPFFKPLPGASKDPLDTLLMSSQISNYCAQMTKFAGAGFGKLFLAGTLQK